MTEGNTVGCFGVAGSSSFFTLSLLDFVKVRANRRQTVVHVATFLRMLSSVWEVDRETADGEYPGNMATTNVVTAASWFMAGLTSGLPPEQVASGALSPGSYLWFAPNSRLNFRLNRSRWWLSASAHTEFVLARGVTGERGVLFSPRLGLVHGDNLPPAEWWWSIAFSIGPQYWWGFEEDSRWHGLAASFQLEFVGI